MSKKPPPRKDIERIRRELREAREDATAPTSADLSWARRILDGDEAAPPGDALRPEVAYALVDELVELRRDRQLSHLASIRHTTLAKAARTGLHRLRSHKVDVEMPVGDDAPHQGTGMAVQQQLQSMATGYDVGWERLVWLAEDAPGGVLVFQARLSALSGLQDLQSGTATRKAFKAKARQVLDDLGGALVDAESARWLIHDAVRRCEAAGRTPPRGFVQASQALGPDPGGPHPALDIAPGPDDPDRLVDLFKLPELRRWHPDRDTLRRLTLRVDEAATSRLVLSQAQMDERLAGIVETTVAEFFDEPRCSACRTLLLDTAHIYSVRQDADNAAGLRAAADAFVLPPQEVAAHRFARFLVARVVDLAMNARTSQDLDGRDPGQRDDPDHDHETDGEGPDSSPSRGGLILP